jgi:beta-phosphoglucomutase-like phosphatase (HAD superfamily)
MSVTDVRTTFWWDAGRPADASDEPLRAVVFDLDGALADLQRDGQRLAFNAAFADHGIDVSWNVEQYGRVMCIGDEKRRIASALRKRGFGRVSEEIAAHVYRTKNDLFSESVLVGDVTPRAGLDDLVNSLFFAGIAIAVVSSGLRDWVEPLVRQLIGDGIAQTIVTPDDLPRAGSVPDLHGHALWELGVGSEGALAVTSSAHGLRAAAATKLATLVVTTPYTEGQDFAGAASVRCGYDGLVAAGCEALHRRWWRDK